MTDRTFIAKPGHCATRLTTLRSSREARFRSSRARLGRTGGLENAGALSERGLDLAVQRMSFERSPTRCLSYWLT
jgi:hypothetical protein